MNHVEVSNLISKYKVPYYEDEKQLQDFIEKVFKKEVVPYFREVALTRLDIIDFKIERLGVEVKIAGSNTNLIRQINRYLCLPDIDAILIVTDKSRLANLPQELNGKPIYVHRLYNF